ncbi:MAG: TolC family protein, partial [Bacteroidia bacterium]|nr:TolC family protein [Bacteroidia bacterium]
MRNLIAWVIFMGLPGILFSQQKNHLIELSSLTEAWDYALENNPDLQRYVLEEEKARREVKITQSAKLPSITGSFSGQKNISLATTPLPGEIFGQPGQTVDAQFGQEYNYNAGITISKSILDRQANLQTKIAKESVGLNQLESNVYGQSLKQQITYYYYSYLVNTEALENYKVSGLIADSLLFFTQQKFEEGLIDVASLHQAKINQNLVAQNIHSTQILLTLCEQQLKTYLGLDVEDTILIKQETFDMQEKDFDLNLGVDQSLMLSEKQIELSELQIKAQKAAQLPKIGLNSYLGQQQFRDDFGLSFSGDAWNPYSFISLNLQFLVFSGFANK